MYIVPDIVSSISVSLFILTAIISVSLCVKAGRRGIHLFVAVFPIVCTLCSLLDLTTMNSRFVTADIALSMLPVIALPAFSSNRETVAVVAVASVMFLCRIVLSILTFCSLLPTDSELLSIMYCECVMLMYLLSFLICIGNFVFGHCVSENDFTLWMSASTFVDGVYVSAAILLLALTSHFDSAVLRAAVSVMLTVLYMLSVYRSSKGTLFALLRKAESRFKARVKTVSEESSSGEESIRSHVYKELFCRIEAYFAENRPYLDPNLTIGDLAKSLYTNKVYISRAVGIYRGLNFCQYINEYRIQFAKAVLLRNPTARIGAVALYCGFNSMVSFNSAFKLFEGISPGQWARKNSASGAGETVAGNGRLPEHLTNPYLPADFHI